MFKRVIVLMLFCLIVFAPLSAQEDITDALQDALDVTRAPDAPAVVLYVWTPDGAWGVASGVTDFDTGTPATVEDRFRIGSISKTYVAVTVLQLVESGDIDVDAPISDYLPDDMIANIDGAKVVTVRHLLTMTSGLYEYLQDDFYATVDEDPTRAWTPEDAISEFVYGEEAFFDAGTAFEYTNTNYLLLQLIVEAVTGQPLYVVMRENILDPIGAEDTYTQIQETLTGEFVHGYEDLDDDGELDDTFAINDGAGMGDGGLVATASDVATFFKALIYDGELLEEATMEMMIEDPLDSEYGMGIEVIEDPDYGTVYGHSGSVLGFTSDARYFPDEDVIVVLLHADTELDDSLIYEAVDIVLGE